MQGRLLAELHVDLVAPVLVRDARAHDLLRNVPGGLARVGVVHVGEDVLEDALRRGVARLAVRDVVEQDERQVQRQGEGQALAQVERLVALVATQLLKLEQIVGRGERANRAEG